ncbi:MAG: hypothetical protein RLY87_236 [Chloroflexota bacterium]|jgi:hypothetical protein
MTFHRVPYILIFAVFMCACTAPMATRTYTLPEPSADEQTTLEVRTESGTVLSLVTTNDGTTTRTTFSANGAYAPAWVSANGGSVTIQTVDQQSALIAKDCLQSATDLPLLSAAAIVGPQPGFVTVSDGQTQSTDGRTLWQDYRGSAVVRAAALVALDAHGTGSILLPDNRTMRDAYTWTYRRTDFLETLPRMTVQCTAQELESFVLPFSATGRRMYGGALLAEHADTPATVSEAFSILLRAQGWTVIDLDTSPDRITLVVSRDRSVYRIVLSSTATQSTELTVYPDEP